MSEKVTILRTMYISSAPMLTRAEAEAKLTDEVFADIGDDKGALTPEAY